jgi:hypothetical protein
MWGFMSTFQSPFVGCVGVDGHCFSDDRFGNHFMANHVVTCLVHGVHLCPYLGVWYVLRGEKLGRQVVIVTRPLVFHRKYNQGYAYEAPTVLHFLYVDVPVDRDWGCDAQSHDFCVRTVFFFFWWGGTYVTRYCGHFWPIVQPDDRWGWLWSNWWNGDWQGKPKYSEKTCPSAIVSTTNPTWPDPGANSGRCGGKPATNRLSYDAALRTVFLVFRMGSEGVHTEVWRKKKSLLEKVNMVDQQFISASCCTSTRFNLLGHTNSL